MIIRFKTKRNNNGHRKYLAIDTDSSAYCTMCPRIVAEGIEIKTADYNNILKTVISSGYVEKEGF